MFLLLWLLLEPGVAMSGTRTHETLGDIGQWAIPGAGFATTLIKRDCTGTYQFLKSLAGAMAFTYVLKYSLDSTRPNGGGHSFPSGHTTAAFAGAGFVQRRFGWSWGTPAYLAAGYVGWTRVETGAHWWRDVVAGAAIGTTSNYIFTRKQEGLNVGLEPLREGPALVLRLRF